ncbi:MAG: hypothetical protein FJX03_05045 [Alphaproteobacteria bacterium]|nr:hypothetical protein [Alphaproteobacteria bacterium]
MSYEKQVKAIIRFALTTFSLLFVLGASHANDKFRKALLDPTANFGKNRPLDNLLRAASAKPDSAAKGLLPEGDQATIGQKIHALRNIINSNAPADQADKAQIKEILGLNIPGIGPSDLHFFTMIAASSGLLETLIEGENTLEKGMGAVAAHIAKRSVDPQDAAHGKPALVPFQQLDVLTALINKYELVVKTGRVALSHNDKISLDELKYALGVYGYGDRESVRLLKAYLEAARR